MTRALVDLDPKHVEAGLFGADPQEQSIRTRVTALVAAAERVERLHYFRLTLAARAWTGTPVAVTPVIRNRVAAWEFADGQQWQVEQDRGPRHPVRLIVGGAEGDANVLTVRAYRMRGSDVAVRVRDAHLVQ